jgi:hypothetical protein
MKSRHRVLADRFVLRHEQIAADRPFELVKWRLPPLSESSPLTASQLARAGKEARCLGAPALSALGKFHSRCCLHALVNQAFSLFFIKFDFAGFIFALAASITLRECDPGANEEAIDDEGNFAFRVRELSVA